MSALPLSASRTSSSAGRRSIPLVLVTRSDACVTRSNACVTSKPFRNPCLHHPKVELKVAVAGWEWRRPDPARPRPRVRWWRDGIEHVAIGRPGEHADGLLAEIHAGYPLAPAVVERQGHSVLADYLSGTMTSQEAAKALGMRKGKFLELSKREATARRDALLDDVRWENVRWHGMAFDMELYTAPPNRGIGWTRRTGEKTTRGKPKLEKIGVEAWYGGRQLYHPKPGLKTWVRWKEKELLGPIRGDWWTLPAGETEPKREKVEKPEPGPPICRPINIEARDLDDGIIATSTPEFDFEDEGEA